MKCPNCGAQLEEGSKFCYDCGTDITATNVAPEQPVVEETIETPTLVEPSVVESTPVVEEMVVENTSAAQDEMVSESVTAEPVEEQKVLSEEIMETTPTVTEEVSPAINKKNKTLFTIAIVAVVLALLVAAFYIFKDYFI